MLLKTLRYFNDVALKKRKLYKGKKKKNHRKQAVL